ncbi:unnamed protein product [Peniophora sp. CBMAI 1063]|nr:unnamed protein product [Peniophora sp. CBMAI 1063]
MAPATKRRRLSQDSDAASSHSKSDAASSIASLSGAEQDASDAADEFSDEPNTDDEIAAAGAKKSKKTAKRKHRATDAAHFGAALQGLLSTSAPTSLPLALKPEVARRKNEEALEKRARRVLTVEKKEKEDLGRVRDVIGGWGGESERALRKVAQRGVVKLFNAIQQAQMGAREKEEEVKALRGSGKPTLPAPSLALEKKGKGKPKGKNKDNELGRAKDDALGKDDFLDMIRSGGIVSRT